MVDVPVAEAAEPAAVLADADVLLALAEEDWVSKPTLSTTFKMLMSGGLSGPSFFVFEDF